jgi:hypothetical protein
MPNIASNPLYDTIFDKRKQIFRSQHEYTNSHIKKIPIHERSVLVGDIIVVNGHGVNRTSLEQRFSEGGYQSQQTRHFLLLTRLEAPKTILVHWFAIGEIVIAPGG